MAVAPGRPDGECRALACVLVPGVLGEGLMTLLRVLVAVAGEQGRLAGLRR